MPEQDRKPLWGGPKAIGAFATRMLDPVARARGFATTAILSEWPAVVGTDLAQFTVPERLVWPRRVEDEAAPSRQSAFRPDGAMLVLRVDGPRAIEVQHRAEQILERVNAYFGYRAVAQLRFLQAPIKRETRGPSAPPVQAKAPPISGISDESLSAALGRLGAGVRGHSTQS
jgi:hypothetical protein